MKKYFFKSHRWVKFFSFQKLPSPHRISGSGCIFFLRQRIFFDSSGLWSFFFSLTSGWSFFFLQKTSMHPWISNGAPVSWYPLSSIRKYIVVKTPWTNVKMILYFQHVKIQSSKMWTLCHLTNSHIKKQSLTQTIMTVRGRNAYYCLHKMIIE